MTAYLLLRRRDTAYHRSVISKELKKMEIELKISEKVKTIDEFLDSIKRENSRFKVRKSANGNASLHLEAKMFDFFGSYGSPAVSYVKGIIDSTVLNNLNPTIKLKGTLFYKCTQYFLIIFHAFILTSILINFDILWVGITITSLVVFLSFNHFMYKMGEAIFHGKLYDEIRDGKRIQK